LTVSASDVDALFSPSPPYDALIDCEPALSDDVVNAACALPLSVLLPMFVAPEKNVTVPVGRSAVPVTVAVNVTGEPAATAFVDELSAVDVPTLATFNVCVADVLVARLPV
jgi:hypothetical protein